MGNLVIVGGGIGVDLVRHLFEIGAPIDTVVLTRPTQEVIDLVRGRAQLLEHHKDKGAFSKLGNKRFPWLLNLWSSTKIPPEVLALADHRLNLHPGLLPMTRGGDCVTWAMRKRLPMGASLMEMDETFDTGAVYVEERLPYPFPATGGEMHARVKTLCLSLFKRYWPDIRDGKIKATPQSGEARTYLHKETAADRLRNLDDDKHAREFVEWSLAHDFGNASKSLVLINGKIYALSVRLTPT